MKSSDVNDIVKNALAGLNYIPIDANTPDYGGKGVKKLQNTAVVQPAKDPLRAALDAGTLTQAQADQIAQKIFVAEAQKAGSGASLIEKMKKSGYDYNAVATGGTADTPIVAHGEAVKSQTQKSTTTPTTALDSVKSFFTDNKTAIIVVGCFALAGTAYYFYTKKKK